MRVGIVGATGIVGTRIIQLLQKRSFPVQQLQAVASQESRGKVLKFAGRYIEVQTIEEALTKEVMDLIFLCAGEGISKQWAMVFAEKGSLIIDNSPAWRRCTATPLIVPELYDKRIERGKGILANPNCVAIPVSIVLHALLQAGPLKRVCIISLQSVSGAGRRGVEALLHAEKQSPFSRAIAHNLIPQIGEFVSGGRTEEEDKIVFETRKILSIPDLPILITAVRVPILKNHSIVLTVEFEESQSIEKVQEVLCNQEGLSVDIHPQAFTTPLEMNDEENVWVGRIRKEQNDLNCFSMWMVADNINKGAALNAVQIAEVVQKQGDLIP